MPWVSKKLGRVGEGVNEKGGGGGEKRNCQVTLPKMAKSSW